MFSSAKRSLHAHAGPWAWSRGTNPTRHFNCDNALADFLKTPAWTSVAIAAFFNLAKRRAKLVAARNITTRVRSFDTASMRRLGPLNISTGRQGPSRESVDGLSTFVPVPAARPFFASHCTATGSRPSGVSSGVRESVEPRGGFSRARNILLAWVGHAATRGRGRGERRPSFLSSTTGVRCPIPCTAGLNKRGSRSSSDCSPHGVSIRWKAWKTWWMRFCGARKIAIPATRPMVPAALPNMLPAMFLGENNCGAGPMSWAFPGSLTKCE